ncbi:MAG: hypothetical protein GXY61_02135 [Lentisphaerae bacterium]|nr:hypothetical protein [Lentisphaerota bacterium]
MRTIKVIGALIVATCFWGCVNSSQDHLAPLTPMLPQESPVAIVATDNRPQTEIEKTPSGEYLYSGALFAIEGNEKTVATDIANIVHFYGGAKHAYPTTAIPETGPAILFEINHWYSRTLINPEKAPLVVTGHYAGVLKMYYDGKVVATENVEADGETSIIDTYIVFEKEKEETPKLIWDAMLHTANSAQQNGYVAIHAALLKNWTRFNDNY